MGENWTAASIPDITGLTAVVTGANSGIGLESAREMARAGAEVILASRSQFKAEAAMQWIRGEIPGARLEFIKLDLASLASVRDFAEEFKTKHAKLDILLNNAGVMLIPFSLTEDGYEKTFGTNHLGHFALTGLLLESLMAAPGARVVNVSSNAHYAGELDFRGLNIREKDGYTPMKAYSRSKLANLLFTYELERRFQARGISALALAAHPGISDTGLVDHLFNRFWIIKPLRPLMGILFQNSSMGALPSLRAALDPQAKGGEYYGPNGPGERSGFPVLVESNSASKNSELAGQLWKISQEMTGVRYLE